VRLVEFPEQTVVIAKDQPEYLPLPAHVDAGGVVTCCWQLTEDELEQVLVTGRIWHQIHTHGKPLQPQLLLSKKPHLVPPEEWAVYTDEGENHVILRAEIERHILSGECKCQPTLKQSTPFKVWAHNKVNP
jgi:hypothetical protein